MDETKKLTETKPDEIQLGIENVKKFFISHLDRIFCAKQYLIQQLPEIGTLSNFPDLKIAINKTMEDIQAQIDRMREIYQILGETYTLQYAKGFKGMIEELFSSVKDQNGNKELQDMAIIYYLQSIESLEMASFQMLQIAAIKFKNEEVNRLLKDNFSEAKAERALLLLLSAKYVTS